MSRPARTPAFAVIRIDAQPDDDERDLRLLREEPALLVTVVSVWSSLGDAEAESDRPNRLNGPRGSRYFWQHTRRVGALPR